MQTKARTARAKIRRATLAVIGGGAVASLGILVYALGPWEAMTIPEWAEAVKSLSILISPYFVLAAAVLLLSRTALASALVLLGSSLTTVVGLALMFRLLKRVDPEGFLYLLLAVSTQWTGVLATAGAASICLLAQWLLGERRRRS